MTAKPSAQKKKEGLLRRHFGADTAEIMKSINASIDIDRRLYNQDIAGSVAHCNMLVSQGLITEDDGLAITRGLEEVRKEIEAGQMEFDPALEDIHMHVEARLTELVGDAGKRLHMARSRNDQVATDFRLWVRDALDGLELAFQNLHKVFIDLAEDHVETVMPGFTHSQPAQPVTFAHYLLAYVEMIGRDRGRLRDARGRLNECPLGSAALAGTSFDIDRELTAAELGFDRPTANSIDSVSDRDFALEALSAAAIAAVHLSRLSEELVLWSSPSFGFVRLADEFSTGSSIMPQKRNPDAAELVRAKSGMIIGSLNALLITVKGLPLAYSKDLQEDKKPTFDSLDTLLLCVEAMTGMMGSLEVDKQRMREMAGAEYSTATDLADWMVREGGLAFRDAYNAAGAVVNLAKDRGCRLEDLPLIDMQTVEACISDSVYEVLSLDESVASRSSQGGTAGARVQQALSSARARYL